MTRNYHKVIKKMAVSLLLPKHSIQFSALFLLLSEPNKKFLDQTEYLFQSHSDSIINPEEEEINY